jgi:hypothetical protein
VSPDPVGSARLRSVLVPLVLLVAVAAVYGRTFWLPYVWDDTTLGLPVAAAGAGPTLGEVLGRDLYSVGGQFYRPLASVTLWLETRAGSASPAVGHGLNLALHLGCLALVLSLALRLGAGIAGAGLAGLWWGMNPVHTEAVYWVSCRADLLCTLLVLGAARTALARDLRFRGLVAGFLCLLAPLAKETGAVALPVALCLSVTAPGRETSRRETIALVAVGLAGLAAAMGLRVLAGIPAVGLGVPLGASAMLDFFAVSARLVAWGAVPFNLSVAHEHYPPVPVGLWLTGALVVAALVAVAIRRWRAGERLPGGLLLATLVALIPAALGARATSVLSERYAHLPLALVALLVLALARGTGIASLPVRRARAATAAAAIVTALFFAPVVVTRATKWESNRSLFEAALFADPESSEASRLLGLVLAQEDGCDIAVSLLAKRVDCVPDDAPTLVSMAACLNMLGRHHEALDAANRARALAPQRVSAWLHAATALAMLGRPDESLAMLDALARAARENDWPLDDRYRVARALAADKAAGPR